MNLTKHFTLDEMTYSETAARLGIDQAKLVQSIGYETVLANLKYLADALEVVREMAGHPINYVRAFRCAAVNDATPGASATSGHIYGLAADIRCAGYGSPLKLARLIEASAIRFDQVIHEYGSWVHFSIGGGLRRETLTKRVGHGYELGLF